MFTTKISLLALLVAPAVVWACPSPPYPISDACLQWTAPTQFTDGTAIPAGTPITYRVYRDGVVALTTTQLYAELKFEKPGNRCYAVSAVVNNAESALSAPGCKLIKLAAPTNGSFEP